MDLHLLRVINKNQKKKENHFTGELVLQSSTRKSTEALSCSAWSSSLKPVVLSISPIKNSSTAIKNTSFCIFIMFKQTNNYGITASD